MPGVNGLLGELGLLAAYGEYPDETSAQAIREAKKLQVPVNHLGGELSPYLLQHARNPVGWYPWCNEAFEAAKIEDKPIFLSIGYSSCHWCHVMERDCFNDPEVAEMMNDTCIPVKVDREERPDLDALYMEVCQVQNGSGGWPLNVFLTPEGFPFFCTTWLPKRTSGQMPGMTDILPRVKWLWMMQRDDITRASKTLEAMMKDRYEIISGNKSGGKIGRFVARDAFEYLRNNFDIRWGGFGQAPKFPFAPRLLFLLKYADENSGFKASRHESYDAFTMVDITLRRMWRGGIHDHLGGGFSRYAVDEKWLVPHFEKLLCDQAMLLFVVSIAQELRQNSFHRLMAEDIIFCAARDFSDASAFSQGFRSAVDADTVDGEGRYYLWTEDEIKAILPEGDAGLFCAAYAVLPSGNFGNELAGSQLSYNILYEASTVTELARRYNVKGNEVGRRLSEGRKLLLAARDKRPAPLYDDKILMDWNGLMIGALARASTAFEQPEWRAMAERTALFVQKNLFDSRNNRWLRRWRGGKAGIDALPADYASLFWGIMEIYKASKKAESGEKQLNDWLKYAQNLADIMIEKFWDEKNGGLFLMSGDDSNVFLRFKSAIDTSVPSVNALAAIALNELAEALEEKKYSDLSKKILECFSRTAIDQPVNYLSLLVANILWKPVKPKPVPKPETVHVPTDEELNREEPMEAINNSSVEQSNENNDERRTSRTARRARTERSERRASRAHRSSRTRER